MPLKFLNNLAVSTYKGLNTAGRGIKKAINAPLDSYEAKLKEMDHAEMSRNIRMIDDNYAGGVDQYLKDQEDEKKKKRILK
jgi:hypothetical protein